MVLTQWDRIAIVVAVAADVDAAVVVADVAAVDSDDVVDVVEAKCH